MYIKLTHVCVCLPICKRSYYIVMYSPTQKNGENKLFLGGLSIHTGKESLMTYFGDFGEVVDTVVIMDLEGKSRGFGFVTFGDRDAYNKCLETTHEIDGKSVRILILLFYSLEHLNRYCKHEHSMSWYNYTTRTLI